MARLTFPSCFRDERGAVGWIEANGLFPIGARPVEGDLGRWRVVIEPRNTKATLRYLSLNMPGVEWQVSE